VVDSWSGKTHRFPTHCEERLEAERYVLEWVLTHDQRERLQTERSARFADAYREWVALKDCREVTKQAYLDDLEQTFQEAFGSICVRDIQLRDVEHLLDAKRAAGRTPRTRAKLLTALRSFFAWAERRELCRGNPCAGVRVRSEAREEPYVMSFEEAERLLGACKTSSSASLYATVLTGLYTGLRIKNVREVLMDDLPRDGVFRLPAHRLKNNRPLELPVHPALARNWTKCTECGQASYEVLKDAARRAGLPHMPSWHTLRRTFASWLDLRSSTATVRAALGHCAPDVTGRYTVAPWEAVRDAVLSLPDLTGGQGRPLEGLPERNAAQLDHRHLEAGRNAL
jgi:integrase/recombinase XerD